MCTTENLSSFLEAFLACRLIPLDKNPELRRIGDGEVLQQIAGKVIVTHARDDIVASAGSLQVCAGHQAGCEPLIHSMRSVYEEQSAEYGVPFLPLHLHFWGFHFEMELRFENRTLISKWSFHFKIELRFRNGVSISKSSFDFEI